MKGLYEGQEKSEALDYIAVVQMNTMNKCCLLLETKDRRTHHKFKLLIPGSPP